MKRKIVASGPRRHGVTVRPARGGFTLVELLVAMIIMALLAALLVAGAMKFKDAQVDTTTDAQLTRLQTKLKEEYNQVLQTCHKEPVPDAVLAYCDDNLDRARAVHTAAKLRANFPVTFLEAGAQLNFGAYAYRPKNTFKSVQGVTGATPEEESAILLYLILTERSTGGSTGDDMGATGERRVKSFTSVAGPRDFTMFIDLYGVPITYSRWASNDELNAAPYLHPSPAGSNDPLDPKRLLAGWTKTAALNADPYNLQFVNRNRVPTVASNGRNKKSDGFGGDDRVGYRLERLGNTGNKVDE